MTAEKEKLLLHIIQNALIQVDKLEKRFDEADSILTSTLYEIDGIKFDLNKAEELLSERNDVADHSGV